MKKRYLGLLALATILTSGLAVVNEHRSNVVDAEETTATIDFSAQGYSNEQAITSVQLNSVLSVEFNKGTNSNEPKYYTSGTAVRVYGGAYFTVSASEGYIINSIDITFGSSDKTNTISTDSGSFTSPTWVGSAESVKFTVDGTSGHRRIKKLEVTYSNEASADPEQTPAKKVMALFDDYYGDGTYVKNTSINVNNSTTEEVKALFHDEGNSLHRTTSYTKEQLVMTLKDNPSYSSTYGTAKVGNTEYMTHKNSSGVEDYRIANTTMENYYVTLNDFVEGKNVSIYADEKNEENNDLTKGWSFANGIYTSTDSNVLDAFRLFTAPLWLNTNEKNEHYIQYEKATVEEDEEKGVLVMKLYAVSGNSGLLTVGAQNVFSVAYIQKGTEHTYHVYEGKYNYVEENDGCEQECLFCADAEAREHVAGSEATTDQKAVCKNCENEYGDFKQEVSDGMSEPANLSFANKTNRTVFTTTQQVWEQDGIILTNDKAASSSNVADYANPARFYASSSIKIESNNGKFNTIFFDCAKNPGNLVNSINVDGVKAIQDSKGDVTITFNVPVDSFIIAKLAGQVQVNSIVVSYNE